MLLACLPLIAVAAGALELPAEDVTSGRAAQVRLAEALSEADSIESVSVSRGTRAKAKPTRVTFTVVRAGEELRLVATTARTGEIASLTIESIGPARSERHALTWLAAELADTSAVVRLAPAVRGGVMLSTDDGRRYLLVPRRGPRTGNEAVEARWGAAWSGAGAGT